MLDRIHLGGAQRRKKLLRESAPANILVGSPGGSALVMNTEKLSSYQDLLDAVDVPLFLVDDDITLLAVNETAKEVFGFQREAFHRRRGGDVLHCLNSYDAPEGCGRGPLCVDCVIRNSVAASLKVSDVKRRRMKFTRKTETGLQEMEVMISARALPEAGPNVTVLTIADVTEVTRLRNILPMCMVCKKIRDDNQFWSQVEGYFSEQIGVDFSHGICPECDADYRRREGLEPRSH